MCEGYQEVIIRSGSDDQNLSIVFSDDQDICIIIMNCVVDRIVVVEMVAVWRSSSIIVIWFVGL